jgi:hypothetical protein
VKFKNIRSVKNVSDEEFEIREFREYLRRCAEEREDSYRSIKESNWLYEEDEE